MNISTLPFRSEPIYLECLTDFEYIADNELLKLSPSEKSYLHLFINETLYQHVFVSQNLVSCISPQEAYVLTTERAKFALSYPGQTLRWPLS